MMERSLQTRLEWFAREVAERWPIQADGLCRFCGNILQVPGAKMDRYGAAEMLLGRDGHGPKCVWVEARDIVRLLG